MIELALNGLQKFYGATMVLKDITFEVQTSEKVAIVGSNGSGKSTLLKIMMGIEGYENGTLSIRRGATMGYLEQLPVFPDSFSVMDVLNTAFEKANRLCEELELIEKQMENANGDSMESLLKSYSQLQIAYEAAGGYEKTEKLNKVCTGLKMGEEFQKKNFAQLSGGEKTTVILGKILLQNSDILLLDEPSNHLDLDTMEWLENFLKAYKGIVIIVSHDRYFLDHVVTKIIEIEDGISKSYEGNYSAYVIEKEAQLQLQMNAFLDQQKKIKAMEKSIAQLRDWGMRGDNGKFFRRAASMQKLLNKTERIDKPVLERESMKINGIYAGRSGNEVVSIKELSKRYGDKVLFRNAELFVRNGESVALIGANGTGKSTILKILLGLEQMDRGTAALGSSVKLGYLPQNVAFENEDMTVLECFRNEIAINEEKAREFLAKYLFYGEKVFKRVGTLSGGERSRLKLAILMYNEVNVLILDEPTNHLDIDSREELEAYLKEFDGTLLFVSHDRYFINNIAGRVVELQQGSLVSYNGNYEYYKEKSVQMKMNPVTLGQKNKPQRDRIREIPQGVKRESVKLTLERQIEGLEKELQEVEKKINQSGCDYQKLGELLNEKLELQQRIEKMMEEYFE